jgi:hypothetical protein
MCSSGNYRKLFSCQKTDVICEMTFYFSFFGGIDFWPKGTFYPDFGQY